MYTVYTSAYPSEVEAGRVYYPRFIEKCQRKADEHGISRGTVAGAYAAVSPNNSEVIAWMAVERLLKDLAARVPAYPLNKFKAIAILAGFPPERILKGRKVLAFYSNISCPESTEVTVDVHMKSAWSGRRFLARREGELNGSEYNAIAADMRRLAFAIGKPVPEVQATIWLVWKRLNRIVWDPQQSFNF